jgi:hypothetical protein
MKRFSRLSLLAAAMLLSACYHQVVQTGRTPGTTVIERPWTATWLWGLVPATEISVAAQCPNGVARVVTEQSFLNGLVGALTLGIYTPQDVRITCASGTSALPGAREIHVADGSPLEARVAAIEAAIRLAERTGESVIVRY